MAKAGAQPPFPFSFLRRSAPRPRATRVTLDPGVVVVTAPGGPPARYMLDILWGLMKIQRQRLPGLSAIVGIIIGVGVTAAAGSTLYYTFESQTDPFKSGSALDVRNLSVVKDEDPAEDNGHPQEQRPDQDRRGDHRQDTGLQRGDIAELHRQQAGRADGSTETTRPSTATTRTPSRASPTTAG